MYLDEVVKAQKSGESKGITSICSSHPWVLQAAILQNPGKLLIESTCNQVNQYGGYSNMTPAGFAQYVRSLAEKYQFSTNDLILGGDHLGPNVWQNEPAESAMQKSMVMIRDYARAGFVKIHLDCSMRLADDPLGPLDVEVSAGRSAQLAKAAVSSILDGDPMPRFIIGTEVPVPGGVQGHEETVSVTNVDDVKQTIQATHEAFLKAGLAAAWESVIAVVVQPGMEFGDDFVMEYQPGNAKELSSFIENRSMVYEAHSTDFQTRDALSNLVRDHFCILKVGPRLTFAFREAVFALAMMEEELFSKTERSNLLRVLDEQMMRYTKHWRKYYSGTKVEQALKRKFSFSDRIRYYWPNIHVQAAFERLLMNLNNNLPPLSLLSQFAPVQHEKIRRKEIAWTPEAVILDQIQVVLADYDAVCG